MFKIEKENTHQIRERERFDFEVSNEPLIDGIPLSKYLSRPSQDDLKTNKKKEGFMTKNFYTKYEAQYFAKKQPCATLSWDRTNEVHVVTYFNKIEIILGDKKMIAELKLSKKSVNGERHAILKAKSQKDFEKLFGSTKEVVDFEFIAQSEDGSKFVIEAVRGQTNVWL